MDGKMLVARCAGLIEADVDGEMVALNIEQGNFCGFNATATQVWRLIEQPRTLDAICDALMREHIVDRETCMRDVSALLDTLRQEGLVTVSTAA